MRYKEQKKRSLFKTVSYRIIIMIATAIVTWVITHRWDLAVGIASATAVTNTILYYIHERIWNMISWGY